MEFLRKKLKINGEHFYVTFVTIIAGVVNTYLWHIFGQ